MMRSLFSGVSGIRAHQTRMDVIGNNIANVNTVAYKSQSMTFNEVFYQTTQTATGPNATTGRGGTNAKQIGLGSSVGAISTSITSEGYTERTDNATDLAITGANAFFIVSSGGETFFTRAGNFTRDEAGALVTQSGANVMGWQVDPETGDVVKDKVSKLYLESADTKYTMPEKTTGLTLTGNINSSSDEDTTATLNFYDSLGSSYQATIKIKRTGTSGTTGSQVTYSVEGSSVTKDGEKTNLSILTNDTITFNSDTGVFVKNGDSDNITFTIEDPDGTNLGDIGNDNHEISVNVSGLKMIKDKTSINQTYGIYDNDAGGYVGGGKAAGTMTSVGIDTSGRLVASYSNGDTKYVGQIAVTEFTNPAGLEKVGENLYKATLNSGIFDGEGKEISDTAGKIQSGVLEMSNVDLAAEFTNMITTQRGYQANSRIITVSDTLLDELINLKR